MSLRTGEAGLLRVVGNEMRDITSAAKFEGLQSVYLLSAAERIQIPQLSCRCRTNLDRSRRPPSSSLPESGPAGLRLRLRRRRQTPREGPQGFGRVGLPWCVRQLSVHRVWYQGLPWCVRPRSLPTVGYEALVPCATARLAIHSVPLPAASPKVAETLVQPQPHAECLGGAHPSLQLQEEAVEPGRKKRGAEHAYAQERVQKDSEEVGAAAGREQRSTQGDVKAQADDDGAQQGREAGDGAVDLHFVSSAACVVPRIYRGVVRDAVDVLASAVVVPPARKLRDPARSACREELDAPRGQPGQH
eukprot:scaffold7897_cov248-Pinguiococcus_pyrenoidosus.AAC.3